MAVLVAEYHMKYVVFKTLFLVCFACCLEVVCLINDLSSLFCVSAWFILSLYPLKASQWRVPHRQRLSVMTREMAPAMCATGPRSQGNMQSMCSATMKTSNSVPSWQKSRLLPRTSTLRRQVSHCRRGGLNKGYVSFLCILALVLYADAFMVGEELIASHLDICGGGGGLQMHL